MGKYRVKVDMPNRPTGDPIEVPSVGVFENGSSRTVELSEAQAEALKGGFGITVTATKGGGESSDDD